MANSLEIRVPFLDRDVVDWTFSLAGDVLLPRRAQSKHILRNACADLYSATQLDQPKRGFALPFAKWLRGSLRDRIEAYFDQLRTSGIMDSAGLDRIHHGFYSQGDDRAWSRVWALVTLASWLQAQHSSKAHAAAAAAV